MPSPRSTCCAATVLIVWVPWPTLYRYACSHCRHSCAISHERAAKLAN